MIASSPSLDHLSDHLELMAASLRLRACALASADEDEGRRWLTAIAEWQQRIEARAATADLASARLVRRLALTTTEEHVVWLLCAIAMRRDVRALVARCSGEPAPDPTLEAIRSIVYGDAPSREGILELGPRGTLRRFGIIEPSERGEHESRQTWVLARRVVAWLHGQCGMADIATGSEIGDVRPLPELAFDARTVEQARSAIAVPDAVLVASGLPGLGRRTLLVATMREAGYDVLELHARQVQADRAAEVLRAFALECRLLHCAALFPDLDQADDAVVAAFGECIDLFAHVLVTRGVARRRFSTRRPVIDLALRVPDADVRARAWGRSVGGDAEGLAARYPIAPALVVRAISSARKRSTGERVTHEALMEGIRAVLDERVAELATRVEVTQAWDDLVLGEDQGDAVLELLGRVRGRAHVFERWGFGKKVGKGLGVAALFSGPPGTGKTMLASLVARELEMDLYQVDLGKVVSKYIGETEKNLGRLFDAAEAGHAILLFDEADSLFGKRTQVKSSNDRYANLETNYLLQRLETFTGVCLLTSNHEGNLDPAFTRRLAVHIRFEIPDAVERAQLWRAVLTTGAPIARDLPFDELARDFELTGGHIRNAVLAAAFEAAAGGGEITAARLRRAARAEYRALGKLLA